MLSRPIFLLKGLVCLFVYVCEGAPPDEVGNDPLYRLPFTIEEDQFIVDELSRVYDGTLSLRTTRLWDKIAEKLNENWKQGTPGFPKERTPNSLRNRLNNVLIFNDPNTIVKVPEDLLKRSANHRRAGGDIRHHYTRQEDEFIFTELSKPSYENLYGKSTIEKLANEHSKKRIAGTTGFQHARYETNIRTHLCDMKRKGLIPKDVLDKFVKRQKGASAGTSSSSSQQTQEQVSNEEPDEDDWVADMLHEFQKET